MCHKHRGMIAWILIVAMIYSPSLVLAQTPSNGRRTTAQNRRSAAKAAPAVESSATSAASESSSLATTPAATSSNRKIDLSYVTPEAVAAVVAYPRQVLTAPEMEMLPTEVITAAGKKELGIDPLQIEQIIAIAEPPQAMLPTAGVVLRMAAPVEKGKILGPLWDQTTEAQLDGKPYRQGAGPMGMSIFSPDDRTVLIASDPLLKKMLSNRADPKEGRMSKVLGRVSDPPDVMAILLIEPIRPLLAMPLSMVPVPPPFDEAKKLPDLVTSIGVKANLSGNYAMSLTLRANDAAAAQQVEEIIDKLLAGALQLTAAQMAAQQPASSDPVEQAMAQYSKRSSERMLKALARCAADRA